MIRRGSWTLGVALFSAAALLWACGGGKSSRGGPTGPGSMMGRVHTLTDAPVPGAQVTIGTTTETANDQGWFFFNEIPAADHVKVTISAGTFVRTQRFVDVKAGRNAFLDVHLFDLGIASAINGTTGGALSNGLATVSIPAGAFRNANGSAFTGSANVSLTLLDPSSMQQRQGIPGGFMGVPSGATAPVPFESFGMFNIDAQDGSGNPLTLDSSISYAATFAPPTGVVGTLPASVPLWNYSESLGTWLQTGSATLTSNNTYAAMLTGGSGSSWNCDQPYATACVTGQIVTPEMRPAIAGIEVTSEGVSYLGSYTTYTDEQGRFKLLLKASDATTVSQAQIFAQGGGLYTNTPTPVNPTPMELASTGNCTDVGQIMLAYPIASVVLTWGAAPSDLDTHLTGPDGTGMRFHMYFSDKNPAGNVAALDTDDTSAFGPEVTSLLKAAPGTYVYSIKNYSGESGGPILASGAQIRAFFAGETRTFDVADATGGTTDDTAVWRVFKFNIGSDGSIGHLQPIMKIVPDDGTDAAFEP